MSECQRKFLLTNDKQMYAINVNLSYVDVSGNAHTAVANARQRASPKHLRFCLAQHSLDVYATLR